MSKKITEYIYENVCKQCNIPLKLINKSTCQNSNCGEVIQVLIQTITKNE